MDRPSKGVGRATGRDLSARPWGNPRAESCGVDRREKLWREPSGTSVPETDTGGRGEQPQVHE